MDTQIESQGFENYFREKQVSKWRGRYFPYGDVKRQTSEKYLSFVKKLRESEGGSPGKDVKILFFGDNAVFNQFIEEVDTMVKFEFSKCGVFYEEVENKMLANIYALMLRVKRSRRADLKETFELSGRLKELSAEVLRVINFVQLNRLALKQTLRNIDKEFHAFDSQTFKNFFVHYYNEKDSHMKRFFEHPGTLRAFFQLEYLVKVVERGLQQGLDNNDLEVPEDMVVSAKKPPVSSVKKKEMFSFKMEMDEFSAFRDDPQASSDKEFDTNYVEFENPVFGRDSIPRIVAQIRRNLESVKATSDVQTQFFRIHENNMLKQLDIQVQDYFEEDVLRKKAFEKFTDDTLTKEEFIKTTVQYDKGKKMHKEPECYSMLDLYLVYIHTFFYFLNYYGMAQTSPDYSKALGLSKSLSGVLQAASPAAAIFFGFFINCITKTKYRSPYILCLSMLVVGNFLYYIAKTVSDENNVAGIVTLVAGRMIFGSGGSRLMTRKFIAINVPSQYQSKYSTYLVGFSALGISLGPGISSLFEFVPNTTFTVGSTKIYFTTYNILSFVFFGTWLVLFLIFLVFFKGYDVNVEEKTRQMYENEQQLHRKFLNLHEYYRNQGRSQMVSDIEMLRKNQANFYGSGLLVNPSQSVALKNHANPEGYQIVIPGAVNRLEKRKTSFRVLFPNDMTWYSLWCFLIFKIIQEAYFTEQPQMFDEYYQYKSQIVGWFMLSLTLVGVPTALITGAATKKFEDRKILLIGFILYIMACAGKVNYEFDQPQPFAQYIAASVVLFIASLVAEAAAISILAKVISPSLKLGFFNAGLLAGTADTVGRALGNSSMTLFSSFK